MIKGIIFDVDGVIVNTENTHYLAFKDVLLRHQYQLTYNKYKEHFSGKSIKGGVLSLLADESIGQGQSVDGFIQTITEEKIASTIEQFKDHVDFFEDTLLFLNKIREGNVALKGISEIGPHPILAITTGLETPLLNQILQYHDLSNIISVIVTAEQYTHSKPHPECYQMTLNRMGCSPDEIIGIEDAPSGIRALNAAGIRSIAVANTHEKSELHEAYITVDRLVDLIV